MIWSLAQYILLEVRRLFKIRDAIGWKRFRSKLQCYQYGSSKKDEECQHRTTYQKHWNNGTGCRMAFYYYANTLYGYHDFKRNSDR